MFEEMMHDTIHLVKPDGGRVEGIKAVVQPAEIITLNTALELAQGDRIEREERGGVETFLVLGAEVVPAQGAVPAFCRVQVRKQESAKAEQAAPRVVYGVTGPATRLHLSALDRTTAIQHVSPALLFERMREAAAAAIQGAESEEAAAAGRQLAERIEALAASFGTPDFAPRYADFAALAVRQMPVFSPFLPALGQLLGA